MPTVSRGVEARKYCARFAIPLSDYGIGNDYEGLEMATLGVVVRGS